MTRRRLNDRQRQRIEKNIQELIDAFLNGSARPGLEQALVLSQQPRMAIVQTADRKIYKALPRQHLGPVVCGDQVIIEPEKSADTASLLAVLPRRTRLEKSTAGNTRPFAANIDLLFIVLACEPAPQLELLDRYLVVAEHAGIRPVIVLNKIDLLEDFHADTPPYGLHYYQALGYQVLFTSAKQYAGLQSLSDCLAAKTGIFAGQSGVGKSSLTLRLIPDLDTQRRIQTSALSDALHGRHTTSRSVLYTLDNEGRIIDSPGVRDIGLEHLEVQQVAQGFVEFREYLGQCRFSDCRHRQEPGCALRQAAEEGSIAASRLSSYHRILGTRPA